MNNRRIILVAGLGMSPAVLTETVWALAHQKPAVVPDGVVALVTESGRTKLREEILKGSPSVWERMCQSFRKERIDIDGKLVFGETMIRVIPDERGDGVGDLRTGDDNLRAADFMLQQLRQYTESPDTVVLASIAGGRKTMSALLFSCMTLLGREDDKVFHVLLPPEFEGGVEPPMYYPVKGVTYTNRFTGKKYKSDKFHSELFEVPFVRMRGWYQEKFKMMPPSYRTLVSKIQTVAPPAVTYPEIEIDALNGKAVIGGQTVKTSSTGFAALLLIAEGCQMERLHERLMQLHNSRCERRCVWLDDFRASSRFHAEDRDDYTKTLSALRESLKNAGVEDSSRLVPLRHDPITFPLNLNSAVG